MEAVNGLSEGDKGGPPPPSPLTGCYLLIVIGEPHSKEHKDIILQRVAKGLLSWDVNESLVDLEKELAIITEQAPEGEEARHGERLIQFASENLVTEVLIHPVVSTLAQCVRNLLSSFTRHRHIIHSGYTFAANGSWVLQDGTFSLADFSEAFQEIAVQRVIRAYENGISLDIHCSQEGDWTRLPKDPFTKSCKVRVNPNDVLTSGSPSIASFIDYISPFLIPIDIETLLESSDVVGNIRFSHPTLYVFPGGQGDAALFGINGFNMLLDGGFSRKACFWDFVRHLDRLDSVLLTRLNNSNINGISSVLRRKRQNAVYPQIGHFFCNIQERKALLSPDGDKDKDPLLINLLEEGQEMVTNLHHLNLCPQICYRDSEPINLYHKVGHGTLDMYVLSPAKESKEVREFLHKWNNNDPKLFAYQRSSKEFTFPLPNLVSICALLVWQPANPEDSITRILYPGSTPQHKIFEGLDKLKHLEFIKYPVCSEKMLASTPSIVTLKRQAKDSVLEKIIQSEQKQQKFIAEKSKQSPRLKMENKIIENNLKNGDASDLSDKHILSEKVVKKSDSTDSEKSASKQTKPKKSEGDVVNGKNDDKVPEKPKPKSKEEPKPKPEVKKTKRGDSLPRKPKPVEKKASPTTPKKTIETKLNGELKEAPPKTRPPLKSSPSATPAKSTKDANNRKVVESKYAVKKEPTKPLDKKPERKPISRRPKGSPPAKMPGSPMKKVNGIQKPDTLSRKAKLDKEGTTDSSTVSTPSADQDSILKKDISKLTPEELERLKAQELADLKEEQEVVKEIEAVFRKGEKIAKKDEDADLRKVQDVSLEDKVEPEEYLIIEKQVVAEDSLEEKDTKEDEIQKLTRDSEESEKQREPTVVETAKEKPPIEPPESVPVEEAEKHEVVEEPKAEASKEISVTSPEEKLDVSSEKRTTDRDVDDENKEVVAAESQPDEKISGTVESGATTTAPTLPEDERIPLDEIKEDNGDQVIEEKHVKEDTKEKEIPVIHLPPKTTDAASSPKAPPPVVGIKLEKQTPMRDIVKTPDEVADLPVHEEVDAENYEDYQSTYKGTTPTDDQKASIKTAELETKDAAQEVEKPKDLEKYEEDTKKEKKIPGNEEPNKSSPEKSPKETPEKPPIGKEPKKVSPEKEEIKDTLAEKLESAETDDKKISEIITNQLVETDDKKLSDEILKKEEISQDIKPSDNLQAKVDEKLHDKHKEPAESPKKLKDEVLVDEIKSGKEEHKMETKASEATSNEEAPSIKDTEKKLEKHEDITITKEEQVEKEPKEMAEAAKIEDTSKITKTEEVVCDKVDVPEKDKTEKANEFVEKEPKETTEAAKIEDTSKITKTEEVVRDKVDVPEKDKTEKANEFVEKSVKHEEEKPEVWEETKREEANLISSAIEVTSDTVCDKIVTSEKTIKEIVDTKQTSVEEQKPPVVDVDKHPEEQHLDTEEVAEEKEKIEPMEKESVDLGVKEVTADEANEEKIDKEKSETKEKAVSELQKQEHLQEITKLKEDAQEVLTEIVEHKKEKVEDNKTQEMKEVDSKDSKEKHETVAKLSEHVQEIPTEIADNKKEKVDDNKTEETKEIGSKEKHETDAKAFKPEQDMFEAEKSDAFKPEKNIVVESTPKIEIVAKEQKDSDGDVSSFEKTERGVEKTNGVVTESEDPILGKPQSEEIVSEKSKDKVDSAQQEKPKEDFEEDLKSDEILIVSRVEKAEHAEAIVIPPSDSTPESPVSADKLKQNDFIEKMELGRKSPKEREEDVAKIVASVAEVLKSDAPLEEFEGKLPFKTFTPFTPYTTELRETHITTVDSPVTDDNKIIKSIDTNIIETAIAEEPPCLKEETDMFLNEERKASPVFPEKDQSKITTLMRDSAELMEATSKIISEIKSGKTTSGESESEENPKEDQPKEDPGVVHRMLVTASSEDGGEETVICPPGSITFSRSSESSGRSSPDVQKTTSQRPSFDGADTNEGKDTEKKDSGKSSPDLKRGEIDKKTPKMEENAKQIEESATEVSKKDHITDVNISKGSDEKVDARKDSLVNGFNDIPVVEDTKPSQHIEAPSKDIRQELEDAKMEEAKKSIEAEEKATKVDGVDVEMSSTECKKLDVSVEPTKETDRKESDKSQDDINKATHEKIGESGDAKHDKIESKDSDTTKKDLGDPKTGKKELFGSFERFDGKTEEAFGSLPTDGCNDSDFYKDQEMEEFRRETGADSGIESFNDFGELDKELILKDSEGVVLNGTIDTSPSSIETIKTNVSEKLAKIVEVEQAISGKETIGEIVHGTHQHQDTVKGDKKEIDVPSDSTRKTVTDVDKGAIEELEKAKDEEPQPKESVINEKQDSEIKDSVKIGSVLQMKEENQEHPSGKSTPEILNGKPELSGKSTPECPKDKTSGKSTPDVKEEIKCSSPDGKLSGKSSPVVLPDKNLLIKDTSGKSTPEMLKCEEISGKSSPNLLTTSGKTTPELPHDKSATSGKSTPEIKLESVRDRSESIPNASLASGVSTPEIRESSKSVTETEFDMEEKLCDRFTRYDDDVSTVKEASMALAGPSNVVDKEITTSSHLSPSKTSEEVHLSGKSTPDIADVEKNTKGVLGIEKHISGSSTPPTVPVSPVVVTEKTEITSKKEEISTTTPMREAEQRSLTPGGDGFEVKPQQVMGSDKSDKNETEEDDDDEEEDIPGSPLSMTSQVAHSRSSSHYDFEEDKFMKGDQMTMSFYGSLPDDPTDDKKGVSAGDVDFEQAIREHQEARGEILGKDTPTYLYEVTKAKYSTSEVLTEKHVSSGQDPMTCSFIGSELPSSEHTTDDKKDPIASWGKPLGLPSPAPPVDNKGTPKKERKLPPNVTAKNKLNDDKKRSESPSKFDRKQKKMPPVYVDLTYVPHHGNSNYSYVDFFKRVRARYYVFSGIEPSKEVYNALLEAKQTWDDKDLEVTIIPTYDTDILGYWVAENEDLLAKFKIDLSPSASRCTINLQDHETSCSAYRLEF